MTKSQRTRQYIIEKAAPLFNSKGLAGTTLSDLMKATKMAKGSLYVHFQNKEELTYEAVDFNLKLFKDKSILAMSGETTSRGKLFAMLDFLDDPVHHPVQGGCPMINFGSEADDTNNIIREKVFKAMIDVQQTIADFVEKGKENGEFSKDWNSKEFALKMYAMVEGGVMISRVSGSSEQMKVIINILKNEIISHTL